MNSYTLRIKMLTAQVVEGGQGYTVTIQLDKP